MKRSLLLVFFGLLTINLLFAQTLVPLAPSTPQLTAVDPYANAANSADGLKPARPFWYSVDQKGLTILRIDDNTVVYYIPWPATIPVVQPDGEYVEVPAPVPWEPVAMTVTYPTEEALASNSETPPTFVYVVMAHSGFEWQSNPNPPAGQDPNLRDTLVPSTNSATESSMLVSVDVTDPTFDPGGESAAGPMIAGAILGHGAGQPAYDPSTDLLYIGNLPSTSLPADLQSFVSVIAAMAPPVAEPAGAGPPVPEPPIVNLCGPEHPDEGLLVGEPYVWACTESGDGPAIWEFQNLPPWLMAHQDKISGELDGLVYGTPTADGTWIFLARVTDYGDPEMGPLTSDWYTVTVNVIPTGVASEAEAGFEAGIPGGQGIGGTGDCTPAVTSTPGSMVPNWIDVQPALVNDVVKGCYVMGTAPISGEYYEFALPNFHFNAPFNYESVILSGNVAGPYVFDPLPAGVSLSGLAWHQIEKIHDPSTEADILNVEFIGVEPTTGQLYRILPPQGSIETGDVTSAPEVSVETDKITVEGEPLLASLKTSRPDISAQLTGNRVVAFGDLVVEADRDIFVTAPWILDPDTSAIIPIGGPTGSDIENGVLIKVSGATISAIDLEKAQAHYLGLDSNLAPAIPGVEPGQKDNGFLWVTGTNTGSVTVVDTAAGTAAPSLAVSGATSLGGVSVDTGIGFAYVAGLSLGNVTIFGTGTRPSRSPVIWSGAAAAFNVGIPSSFTVMATGLPTPALSYTGTLPSGVTFTDNGNGTAALAGTPTGPQGDYSLTIKAANGISPDATQAFILTIAGAPVFTSANTTTFTVGSPGSFLVTTNGAPSATIQWCTNGIDPAGPCTLPSWLTFTDNEDGTSTLGGTPPAGSEGTYTIYFWASTGVPPDAMQAFTLIVNGPGQGGSPVITLQPASLVVTAGETATFTSAATGNPSPTVQWQLSINVGVTWSDIAGATSTSYTTPVSTTAMNGYQYRAVFTNSAGSAISNAATLSVNASGTPPEIVLQPTSVTVTEGQTATFTSAASGSPTPTVQWQLSTDGTTWSDIAGATSTTYTTPATTATMNGYQYRAVFTNSAGTATSNAATLTVNTTPVITLQPTSVTATAGQTATFTAAANGRPTPTVQWQLSADNVTWSDITGATSTSYTTPATTMAMNGYRYRAVFTNIVDSTYSNTATLTVKPPDTPPAITSASSTTFTVGSAGSFPVTTTGSPTPTLSYTGGLPSGVTFKDNGNGTATLAGTPAAGTEGSYPLIITATNGVSPNAIQNFTLTVNAQAQGLRVVTTSLPNGKVGVAYSAQLEAQGGTPPYRWRRTAGNLPRGLTLSSSGMISGIPNRAGTYSFTVRVTDSASHTANKAFTVTIAR